MKNLTKAQKQILGVFVVLGLIFAAKECSWVTNMFSQEAEVEAN